ncbi:IS110 family transposase [Saccharicrinis aurantiacus]|uniref:IS110 family transposase n=1 Tax=Saccharicrinis aurantiacus TaxID=1849719 RepID=UPI002492FD73|nr:IS110 family transposase [Saccharicrinis aurantiacus]
MKKIRKNAGGIDIGAKKVFTSIEDEPVVSHLTFTEDLNLLCSYLLKHGIETVAMEATGVYWVILYEILEKAGIDVWLVDGRQTKQVPGRKTDVKDCQWIRELHSYGLLNRCLVVDKDIKELRSYMRLREDHIRSASMYVNQMQKALTLMNIRLKEVISQLHGKSGISIIASILEGERDREVLTELCHPSILKNKRELILKSLDGTYTESGLFALSQAYNCYYFYQDRIAECDDKINQVTNRIGNSGEGQNLNQKRKPIRHNKPNIDNLGANLKNIFGGQDATVIGGITDYTWIQLLSETGNDLTKWATEKHFTSWLGLSPGQHHSGKMRKSKRKGKPVAGQIFKIIAQGLLNSKDVAIGAFGRRLRGRKGAPVAVKAMARKLAVLYWRVMVKGIDYAENGIKRYEEQLALNKIKVVNRLAAELNLKVINFADKI